MNCTMGLKILVDLKKGCSCCVHSADVDGVELPTPLLVEAESIDCVISAPV